MNHLFVTGELPLKLQKRGFDEPCIATVDYQGNALAFDSRSRLVKNSEMRYGFTSPLYQQVVDWFREKHLLVIEIRIATNGRWFYGIYKIVNDGVPKEMAINYYTKTYYEALTAAIEEALKLIK